jgi:hypothetical protein
MARDIIQDFVDKKVRKRGAHKGEVYGEYGHIFYDGDILYSYGTHFPLLIRHKWGYLLNADKYSSTTSKHQGYCRSVATIQIPLSALAQAGIPFTDFNLIEKGSEREDLLGYQKCVENPTAKTLTTQEYKALDYRKQRGWRPDEWQNPTIYYWQGTRFKKEYISVAQYQALPDSERGDWNERTERRPEHDVIEYDGRYFLSGMDGQNYFLCQLPEPVKTVDKAIEHLIPNELRVTSWDKEYTKQTTSVMTGVVRQGEWFFRAISPTDFVNSSTIIKSEVRNLYKQMQKDFTLPRDTRGSNTHIATRGMLKDGFIYVTGQVHHSEHHVLKLSTADAPVIYQAYRNRAVASYSVNGRVD